MRVQRRVNKHISRVLLTAVLSFFIMSASAASDIPSITGYFMTHDDSAKIEIYADGDLCQGRAVWNTQHGNVSDMNIIVLRNLAYSSKNKAWIGKLYDPFDQREYNVSVKPLDGGQLQVTPSLGIVSKKLIWQKVSATAVN